MLRMARSLLTILVGLWLITCFVAAKTEPYMPALYVFGDSLANAGNNNYIPNYSARANITPYGVSYFPKPTGHCSIGCLAVDFLASYLRLPFTPPYLQPNATFTTGINFASGGSGLLDTLFQNVWNMSHQISLFEQHYDNPVEAERVKLGKSLFIIVIGGNDFATYAKNPTTLPLDFINLLRSKLREYIKRLYNHGARKFIVFNIPPVGCIPIVRENVYKSENGKCSWPFNLMVEPYNAGFRSSLTQLDEELVNVTIIQVNAYDFLMNIIDNGEAYDFKNTTSAFCGLTKQFCNDPSTDVFWDGGHALKKLIA